MHLGVSIMLIMLHLPCCMHALLPCHYTASMFGMQASLPVCSCSLLGAACFACIALDVCPAPAS
jgi:hypothetical protein